jgi:hypothetical protein
VKVNLIEGTIKFSLIIIDERKSNNIEELLASISSEEIFDFLPAGIIVKDFELDQEFREGAISVSESTG